VPEFVDLGVKAMRSLCAPAASGCANVNVADSAAQRQRHLRIGLVALPSYGPTRIALNLNPRAGLK
jgi:hypothetical protein